MQLLNVVGERGLMNYTGIGLFLICTVCVQFIRGSDGAAISTALVRGIWRQLARLKLRLGGNAGALATAETAALLRADGTSASSDDGVLRAHHLNGRSHTHGTRAAGGARDSASSGGYPPPELVVAHASPSQAGLTVRHPNRDGLAAMARERSIPSALGALRADIDARNGGLKRPRSGSIVVRNGVVGNRAARAAFAARARRAFGRSTARTHARARARPVTRRMAAPRECARLAAGARRRGPPIAL